MKVKIIRAFITSGYFTNDIVEIPEANIDFIKQHNEIQIIESGESKLNDSGNSSNRGRKTNNSNRGKKTVKNSSK